MKILLTFFAKNKIFYFKIESCTFDSGSHGNLYHLYRKSKKLLGVLQIPNTTIAQIYLLFSQETRFFISKLKAAHLIWAHMEIPIIYAEKVRKILGVLLINVHSANSILKKKQKRLYLFNKIQTYQAFRKFQIRQLALNLLTFFARNDFLF